MAVECRRGISVSSAVMSFEHEGLAFNLLDTPGHQDFSLLGFWQDTYRTLTVVPPPSLPRPRRSRGRVREGATRRRPQRGMAHPSSFALVWCLQFSGLVEKLGVVRSQHGAIC